MSFVRRLALGVLSFALLAGAAFAAGHAHREADASGSQATAALATSRPTPTQAASPATPSTSAPTSAPTSATPTVEPPATTVPTPAPTPAPTRRPAPVLEPGRTLLGPGDKGDDVRDLQARLKQIDWFQADVSGTYADVTAEAVRGFQAKREIPVTGEVDQRTMDRLTAMTTEPSRQQLFNLGNTPGALDARCRTGRVLCIDKSSSTLRWLVDGKVLKTVDVRFGAAATPTREGQFTVYYKSRDHVSQLYGSAMPFAMFFDRGQAVHYSSDFAARGYDGASHGCVNVRDYDGVAWLFDQVQVGDKVVVYWS